MQRHAVELRQNVDRAQPRVETVADRNIDQPIFAAERHRRFGAIFGQRKQPRPGAAAHDDGKRALSRARRKRGTCMEENGSAPNDSRRDDMFGATISNNSGPGPAATFLQGNRSLELWAFLLIRAIGVTI